LALAVLIDRLLVPSRFEPRRPPRRYGPPQGSLPFVHGFGGLADAVDDGRTGFSFGEATPFALQAAMVRAVHACREVQRWRSMMPAAAQRETSWGSPRSRCISRTMATPPLPAPATCGSPPSA
jgi:starch synthase